VNHAPTLGHVVDALERLYPPGTAEEWDAVGLVCGDPADAVRRVLFAVDPVPDVVDEALAWQADLLVTHHPLLLRPVHSVATDTPKGSMLHRLIRGGCGLFTAHTNADVAAGGVNDALADVLRLRNTSPLRTWPGEPSDKVVTYVPPSHADAVIDALRDAGAGALGDYTRCAWTVEGTGTFTPGEGATPHIGEVGRREVTPEVRVEMLIPRRLRASALDAVRAAHPYEEGAVDVFEVAPSPSGTGLGRVGTLMTPMSLRQFAGHVAKVLPATPQGVRYFGVADRQVERVAVCGGAGDSLLSDARRAGVDVFVTADLRHHPASEHLAAGGPALVDPGHWASEWPWLSWAETRLREALAGDGTTVETHVSTTVTDPVAGHVASRPEEDR
jgi:dinuclear metal center YbgI/SA1388 family protein